MTTKTSSKQFCTCWPPWTSPDRFRNPKNDFPAKNTPDVARCGYTNATCLQLTKEHELQSLFT